MLIYPRDIIKENRYRAHGGITLNHKNNSTISHMKFNIHHHFYFIKIFNMIQLNIHVILMKVIVLWIFMQLCYMKLFMVLVLRYFINENSLKNNLFFILSIQNKIYQIKKCLLLCIYMQVE